MTTTTHQILCGGCKCAVKTVCNPKAHDKVACPRCGRSDRFDKVMATVQDHFAYLAQQRITKGMAAAVRGKSHIKLKVKNTGNRSFRWVSDARL